MATTEGYVLDWVNRPGEIVDFAPSLTVRGTGGSGRISVNDFIIVYQNTRGWYPPGFEGAINIGVSPITIPAIAVDANGNTINGGTDFEQNRLVVYRDSGLEIAHSFVYDIPAGLSIDVAASLPDGTHITTSIVLTTTNVRIRNTNDFIRLMNSAFNFQFLTVDREPGFYPVRARQVDKTVAPNLYPQVTLQVQVGRDDEGRMTGQDSIGNHIDWRTVNAAASGNAMITWLEAGFIRKTYKIGWIAPDGNYAFIDSAANLPSVVTLVL